MTMQTFRTFDTAAEALQYRKENGTGGYVFATDPGKGHSVLFPYGMTATPVMLHPLVRGLSGTLL
jgi:hypothetical protein